MLSTLFHKYRIDYQTPTFLYYNRYILDGMIIRQHAITCPEHLLSSVGHVIKKGGGEYLIIFAMFILPKQLGEHGRS